MSRKEQKKNSQLLDVAWIYVADELPPNPETEENSMHPLKYFCAFAIGDDEYDCDEFAYLGNGKWEDEVEGCPIYAWLKHSEEIPMSEKDCSGIKEKKEV